MIPATFTIVFGLLATFCRGHDGPAYQKPDIHPSYVQPEYQNFCGDSSFKAIGPDGEILVADCQALVNSWGTDYFQYVLSDWEDTTALNDHFWTVATNNTCQFGITRVDGLQNVVSIGDSDIKDVVNEAISTFANGSFANTVEGTMPCYANGTINASIEWIVRKAQ